MFIFAQKTTCLSHDTKLDGKAQLVVRTSAQLAFEAISSIKRVVADQTVFVHLQTEKVLRLHRINQFSSSHLLLQYVYAPMNRVNLLSENER